MAPLECGQVLALLSEHRAEIRQLDVRSLARCLVPSPATRPARFQRAWEFVQKIDRGELRLRRVEWVGLNVYYLADNGWRIVVFDDCDVISGILRLWLRR